MTDIRTPDQLIDKLDADIRTVMKIAEFWDERTLGAAVLRLEEYTETEVGKQRAQRDPNLVWLSEGLWKMKGSLDMALRDQRSVVTTATNLRNFIKHWRSRR